MKLHARNLAIQSGALPGEVDELVRRLLEGGNVNASKASELLSGMRSRATVKRI
jgi:hydroxymethylglutaryl-CoA reductase